MKRTSDSEAIAEIKSYLKCGVVCQHEIFNRMYSGFVGHYTRLRQLIADCKNEGVN